MAEQEVQNWIDPDDEGALDRIVADNLGEIRQMVRSQLSEKLRRRIDSDDLVQETLVTLLPLLHRHAIKDAAHFRRFLSRLVSNAICSQYHYFSAQRRDHLRLQSSRDGDLFTSMIGLGLRPSEEFSRQDEANRVTVEVLLLPPALQDVLVMHLDGLSRGQIGSLLDISENAVSKRYSRALAKLVNALREVPDRT